MPLSASEIFEISKEDQACLYEKFPVLKEISDTRSRRRIYKIIFAGGKDIENVTWKQVQEAKEKEEQVRGIINLIRRGYIMRAIYKIERLPEFIDLRDYGIADCEKAVRKGFKDCLLFGRMDIAKKTTELFANIDFTEEIISAYSYLQNHEFNDYANQIKEAFTNIDFDSIENEI